jgi:hypothetical protein
MASLVTYGSIFFFFFFFFFFFLLLLLLTMFRGLMTHFLTREDLNGGAWLRSLIPVGAAESAG